MGLDPSVCSDSVVASSVPLYHTHHYLTDNSWLPVETGAMTQRTPDEQEVRMMLARES